MLLVKPVTVSRGFIDVGEEREHLTTNSETETRVFLQFTFNRNNNNNNNNNNR